MPEAATKAILENVCSFLPGAPFAKQIQNFQEDNVCSPNGYHFSRSYDYVFTEQIPIFQEHLYN